MDISFHKHGLLSWLNIELLWRWESDFLGGFVLPLLRSLLYLFQMGLETPNTSVMDIYRLDYEREPNPNQKPY